MPRGDGIVVNSLPGPPRRRRPPNYDNQYIPKGLRTRIEWWENQSKVQGISHDGKTKYLNNDAFRRPGSQKR